MFPFSDLPDDYDLGDTILPEHTERPATAANQLKNDLFAGARAHDVRAYGAEGDGVTDDTVAVQDALDAVAVDGGVVVFPAGLTFRIAGDLDLIRATATTQVGVVAYGATIEYDGSAELLTFAGGGSDDNHAGPYVHGGRWVNTGTGTTCLHFTDCTNARFRDIYAQDWDTDSTTSVFRIRNDDAWSENVSFEGIYSVDTARLVTYEGVAQTGGSGTNSFARQRWHNVFASGGSDCLFYFSDSTGVYDSWFTYIGGNIGLTAATEGVFRLGGGMGGTWFDHIGFEGTGAIFAPDGISSNGPIAGPNISIRSGIQMRIDGASDTKVGTWEHGTWTPTVTQSGSVTLTVNSARFVRQGLKAEVWANLTMTGSGTGSNDIQIGGFPGTPIITSIWVGNGQLGDVSQTPDLTEPFAVFLSSTTVMRLRSTRDNTDANLGAATSVFSDALASGDTIRLHASYPITVD